MGTSPGPTKTGAPGKRTSISQHDIIRERRAQKDQLNGIAEIDRQLVNQWAICRRHGEIVDHLYR